MQLWSVPGQHGRNDLEMMEQMCRALEALLAIDYDKQYRTWRDCNVINHAKEVVRKYRSTTQTTPPKDLTQLKPLEAVTFADGQLELNFASVPESLRELASFHSPMISAEAPPLGRPLTAEEAESLRQLASYEAIDEHY